MTLPSNVRHIIGSVLVCAGLLLASGCQGQDPGSTSDGQQASAADCSSTDADALVSLTGADDGLAAAAVTSGCGQIAVYHENGETRSVSLTGPDGQGGVTAEFDSLGQMVVARDEQSDDKITASYNDALGYARVTEDTGDSVSANIISVARSATAAQRVPLQNAQLIDLCSALEQMVFILTSGCGQADEPARCAGAFAGASATAREFCQAEKILEVEDLHGLNFGPQRPEILLGVDGFVTTRPARAGTTFVLSAVPFGGQPPYEVSWSQTAGESALLTGLPGGGALADSSALDGRFEFQVDVTDGAGASASASVAVDLGEQFTGVVAQANDLEPDVGQTVSFHAATDALMAAGSGQVQPGSPSLSYYWDFGDGSPGAEGASAAHAYTEPGAYTVSLIVVAGVCDFNDFLTIRADGIDDDPFKGAFSVDIVADSAALQPGASILLRAEASGGQQPVKFGWGIVRGHDSVAGLTPLAESSADSSSGQSAELSTTTQASDQIVVGLVAIDATGRTAETARAFPVCAQEGDLFASILGPFELRAGEAGTLQSQVVDCDGSADGLLYYWSIIEGQATLSNVRAASPAITAGAAGELVVLQLRVVDADGHAAEASAGLFVLFEDFGALLAEFLGPEQVPVGEEVPVFSFIGGGQPPYFCSWGVDGGGAGGILLEPFSCHPRFKAFHPGCTFGELRAEDSGGAVGVASFEICAGSGFHFDCPPDGSCDEACSGFDPDCGAPCPLDGFCDQECPIGDPDCFETTLCSPDDSLCDPRCAEFGLPDGDCAHCAVDGVCVFFCTLPDKDCQHEGCQGFDGFCDPSCAADPDCGPPPSLCAPDDGVCHPGCGAADPDCPTDNAGLCAQTGLCCHADSWCDPACPQPDGDCSGCELQGQCVHGCVPPDPDCAPGCDPDLDADCPCDPFSNPNCFAVCGNGLCDPVEHCAFCPQDCGPCPACLTPEDCADGDPCTIDFCSSQGQCVHQADPACGQPCAADGLCDPNCTSDPDCPPVTCAPLTCDDADPCTVDFCDTQGQCVYQADPACTNPCAADGACDPNCAADPDCPPDPCAGVDCDDFDACTIDFCDSQGQCVHDADPACQDPCVPDGVCASDCTSGDPDCPVCGNAICDAGEDNTICPLDCP